MIAQTQLVVTTQGRGSYEITAQIQEAVNATGFKTGLINVFVHHTSASLMLCENADPLVRKDLETFMAELVPDGHPRFQHRDEGPDDMPAHVRSILTHNSLCIPLSRGRCALGTWQGVYLWEHRHAAHRRRLTISIQGE